MNEATSPHGSDTEFYTSEAPPIALAEQAGIVPALLRDEFDDTELAKLNGFLTALDIPHLLKPLLLAGTLTLRQLGNPNCITDAELQGVFGWSRPQISRLRQLAQAREAVGSAHGNIPMQHLESSPLLPLHEKVQPQARRGAEGKRGHRSTVFKGVYDDTTRSTERKAWKAQIERDGKTVYIGRYLTDDAAARAYDDERAKDGLPRLNFPRDQA